MRVFPKPDASTPPAPGLQPAPSEQEVRSQRAAHLRRAVTDAIALLRDAERSGDALETALALHELGVAEHAAGAPDFAVATLERANQLFSTRPFSVEHARTLLAQVTAYEAVERFSEALSAHKQYHAVVMNLNQEAREERARARNAEAQLLRMEKEVTVSLRRQSELTELNLHLLKMDRQKTELLQQAERFSLEDSVTQVSNRRCLDVRLAADVQRAKRYDSRLSIAMVDIDDFKSINDRFSHNQGDEVLRRVAALMRDALRDSDYVARYGGDEFVLVFPETHLSDARMVCELVRQKIAAECWDAIAPDLRITVSIGVAQRAPDTTSPVQLLNEADRMLYKTKSAGKNSVSSPLDRVVVSFGLWP